MTCAWTMSLHKQITFPYSTKDFNLTVKSCEEAKAPFDNILHKMWKQAEEMKAFRYILSIRRSRTLKGKYKFFVQVYLLMCQIGILDRRKSSLNLECNDNFS